MLSPIGNSKPPRSGRAGGTAARRRAKRFTAEEGGWKPRVGVSMERREVCSQSQVGSGCVRSAVFAVMFQRFLLTGNEEITKTNTLRYEGVLFCRNLIIDRLLVSQAQVAAETRRD